MKRNKRRRMWVGSEFEQFTHSFKSELEKTQGRKYSDPEVTDIIAGFNKRRLYFKAGKDKLVQI